MANEVEPEVLVNSILGKFSDVLLNGDGKVVSRSDDHYVAFMSPGIPMLAEDFKYAVDGFGAIVRTERNPDDLQASIGPPPESVADPAAGEKTETDAAAALGDDARQKYMRAEAFHAMCDLVPDTSGIVDSGRINVWNPEARVSSVYAMALQQSQVIDVQPDEETTAKIDRWRSKLQKTEVTKNAVTDQEEQVVRESDLVKAYNDRMLKYLAASLEYNDARISALAGRDEAAVHRFAINGNLLQMKVRAALNDWSTNGFKGDYEALTSAIQSVEERSYTLLKQRFREDYTRSLLTNPSSGANFLYTAPAPASFALDDSGWSHFYFDSGSFASEHRFSASETRGAAGLSIGIFNAAGGGATRKERWDGKLDTKTFRLEFQMCRVPIYRPWFHLDFIKSGFWRFTPGNEELANALISDGKTPPDGLMPALTTECIFVKNLVLTFGERHSSVLALKRASEGKGGLSIGPFWGGGSHSNRSDTRTHQAEWSSQGVRIPGLQLIGLMSYMLPKAPNPKPDIKGWI
jgi:hypothetical protein